MHARSRNGNLIVVGIPGSEVCTCRSVLTNRPLDAISDTHHVQRDLQATLLLRNNVLLDTYEAITNTAQYDVN